MKNALFLLFVFLISFSGCSSLTKLFVNKPDVYIKGNIENSSIAVLNFSKNNASGFSEIGTAAANKLAEALYFTGKYDVIDRSRVNDAQADIGIRTTELLSSDQVQKIGLKLKANYLVLGRIQITGGSELVNPEAKKEISISFRVMSVLNSEVVAMASYSDSFSGSTRLKIESMMNEIVKKL